MSKPSFCTAVVWLSQVDVEACGGGERLDLGVHLRGEDFGFVDRGPLHGDDLGRGDPGLLPGCAEKVGPEEFESGMTSECKCQSAADQHGGTAGRITFRVWGSVKLEMRDKAGDAG